jgi:ASC-1-like (ASCH) protein
MPLFILKKEFFSWIKDGEKTIEVRKGNAAVGDIAVLQSGANSLRLPIIRKETGKLDEIIRQENYRQIIPTADNLETALGRFQVLYGSDVELFTAYYLESPKINKNSLS